jgi:Protein of unknown function (DUF3307)
MITADQLLCHAIGDYILQSDWMANEKTKKSTAALAHVATYGLPFLFLRPSWKAYAVIVGTHFVIDRWRLARFVVWAKNWMGDRQWLKNGEGDVLCVFNLPWRDCVSTGYPPERPAWLAVWLLIIADNIMHVTINGLALKYL